MADLVVNLKVNDDGSAVKISKIASEAKKAEREFVTLDNGVRAFQNSVGRWQSESGKFITTQERLNNGLKNTNETIKDTTKSASLFGNSLLSLRGVLGGLAIGALAKEVGSLADTWNNLEGRLKLVTSSTKNLISVQNELFKVSQNARTSYESTADLYFRLAKSTETLGISQTRLIKVTETISKTLAISGSSAEAANAALMQLGQGFASGTLRGEELNSVLEQAPALAEAIAKGMDKTVGQLRALGAEGKLTADEVFKALEKQGTAIDEQFGKMPKTIGQSITQVKNSILSLVGTTDDAINGAGGVSDIFTSFSTFLDENRADIIEFGRDFLRALQAMGAGVIGVTTGFMGVVDSIAFGVATSLEAMLNRLVDMVNGALSLAQTATNKVRGLFGGDAVNLGSVSRFSFSDEILSQSSKRFQESANAFKTISVLTGEIARNTTVVSKNSKYLNGGGNGSGTGKGPAKEEIEAAKKAAKELADTEQKMFDERMNDGIKRFEEEQRVQLGYLESYADIEAKQALEQFEIEKGYLEAYADLEAKAAIEEYDRQVKLWDDLFSNINKSMESQFFDAMTGRFQSFGSWLKDFWKSITSSLASGLSKTLADYMMGGLKGGIQNSFASFGGLSGALGSIATPSYLAGATTDSAGFTTTVGGTVMDAAGKITKEGSDIASILNTASTIKSAYGVITGGLASVGANLATGFNYLAGGAQMLGMSNLAAGISNFGMGAGSVFTGVGASELSGAAMYGNMAGTAVLGAAGGYALGSLGDKLFGADTKAANYGAIGGTIGAVAGGPIGAVIGSALGSVVGGMFGSTKKKDSGFRAWSDISSETGAGEVQSFADFKKKSWFSSKSWTKYYGLDDKTKKQIDGVFGTYDYLLGQLGDFDKIIVGAGKYSGTSFFSAIDKAFIRAFIDNPTLTDTFYNAWTDYASQIGKGVQETFASLVSGYVDYTRSFQTWALESSGNSLESMRLQAEWAQKDLEAIQSLYGTSGVTADNYLDMYQKAIKESFTPETITQWQTLGDALMKATDANEKYKDSLAGSTSLIPTDMMLSRTGALTEALSISQMVDNQSTQTQQTATMVAQLYEVVKVLKQQLTIAQFGSTSGVPA